MARRENEIGVLRGRSDWFDRGRLGRRGLAAGIGRAIPSFVGTGLKCHWSSGLRFKSSSL
jgi:hypothetical protein